MNRRVFLKVCAGGMLLCGLRGLNTGGETGFISQSSEKVAIDACTLCQLNCPLCYMRLWPNKLTGAGYLKFDDFKKFIDRNPKIRFVELSNSGEIFLNPELLQIIEYAYERNIYLQACGGVNFNRVSDEMLESLVKYNFESLFIALDGACQETYEKYRRGGSFDTVINNIKRVNYYKDKYNRSLPSMVWQFIVFGHNEHEIPKAKMMANELGMSIYFKHSWDELQGKESPAEELGMDIYFKRSPGDWKKGESFSPLRDIEFIRKEIPGFV